jgi:hypothetical protein
MSHSDLDIIMTDAATMLQERDALAGKLRWLDYLIQNKCLEYSQTMRVWGFTPLMLRQACKSRGYLADDLPPTLQGVLDRADAA